MDYKKAPIKITERQQKLLEKIAKFIADKGFTVPTLLFMETSQPLNFIVSQFMIFLEPFLTIIIPRDSYNDIQLLLEQRKGIEYFLTILEEMEYLKKRDDTEARDLIVNMKKMEEIAKEEKRKFKEKYPNR